MLKVNQYAARAAAGQVLFQLRLLADRLVACSDEGRLIERLHAFRDVSARERLFATSRSDVPGSAEQALYDCGGGSAFDAIALLDREGVAVTRAPRATLDFLGRSFAFRNYYQGARALGLAGRREAHFARGYKSEGDSEMKISLSVPIIDHDGEWLGLIDAVIGTDTQLGSLQLSDPKDGGRLAMLIALRDRERDEASLPLPDEHLVAVHEGLAHGQAVPLTEDPVAREWLRRLDHQYRAERGPQLVFDAAEATFAESDHRDPVPGYEGRWLAGVAPVGKTAYAVIVQTRDFAVIGPHRYGFLRLLGICAALVVMGAAVVFLLARHLADRRQRRLRWLGVE